MSKEKIRSLNSTVGSEENLTSFTEDVEKLSEQVQSVMESSATIYSGSDALTEFSETTEQIMKEAGISKPQIVEYIKFLEELEEVISQQVEDNMPLSDEDSIQLRDPEEPGSDKISDWIKLSRYNSIAKNAEDIGAACSIIRNEITSASEKPKTSSASVGSLISGWYKKDNIRYYRSIEMVERKKASSHGVHDWQRDLKAELTIHNCIPKMEISDTLDQFHSSILMSATLEPLDVYHQTTGISELENKGRTTLECRYGLSFPKQNRITIGVPANKFKYSNRGPAFNSRGARTDNETREKYRDVAFDVVQETDGNVMIVMPSYKEAEWIGTLLEQSYICSNDDVFIDKSSSNRETQEMKNEFFSSDQGVLVTGARGTLIEGIDYIGDRLEAAVVCGVPITNTQSEYKQAIKAAYDEVFDDTDGFTLAFTIPAVWKARQAIGRVIRTDEDIGTRVFVDERYVEDGEWDSVNKYLSPSERDEMEYIPPDDVDLRLEAFWDTHN